MWDSFSGSLWAEGSNSAGCGSRRTESGSACHCLPTWGSVQWGRCLTEQILPPTEGVEDERRFKKSSFIRKRILKSSSLENGENI